MKKNVSVRDYSMILALLGIWVFFYFMNPNFVGFGNLANLAIEFSIASVLALGMLLVLLPGEIDLSVGSGVGLTGGIAVIAIAAGWPAWLAMLVAFLAGLAIWYGIGKLITSQKMPSFIVTLGGLLIFKGIFWQTINYETIPTKKDAQPNAMSEIQDYAFSTVMSFVIFAIVAALLFYLMRKRRAALKEYGFELDSFDGDYLKTFVIIQALLLVTVLMTNNKGLPLALFILGLVACFIHVLSKNTPFGRYLYAIGGNREAAVVSGINVDKIVTIAYVILGGLVALTGFMQTAYLGSSTTTIGELMELDAIAACVIGGTALSGGRGSVGGVLTGALIMASLINGMALIPYCADNPAITYIVRGAVLVLAVWVDVKFSKKK